MSPPIGCSLSAGEWSMVAALLLLGYTYFGYPVLLAVLARLFPGRTRIDPAFEPTVTVCIPAFNGAATLDAKLASVVALDYQADKLDILVCSDGSTDDTVAIVRAWSAREPRIRLLESTARQGKPSALNRMRGEAKGAVLLLTDSRQPLAREALRALVARLADPTVGCVTGNLVLAGGAGSGMYWRYENWIRCQEGRFRSVVGVTGPLSLIRRDDLPELPPDIILDDVWIPMCLRLRRRRVLFCPEARIYDQAFGDGREFGRKVRTLAGNYQIFSRMPRLLLPFVNPSWFETFSHKVLRLLCPAALLVLLGASALVALGQATPAIGPALARTLLATQLGFYAAAVIGPRVGKIGVLARTFVILNAAAVVGLWRFARQSQKVTW
jgi:cellulose synthase/poly-beta-1,6-N-acetylglucosamine synthase-like glycosyltransferase